jgi:hypothetical protein
VVVGEDHLSEDQLRTVVMAVEETVERVGVVEVEDATVEAPFVRLRDITRKVGLELGVEYEAIILRCISVLIHLLI